MSLTQGLSNRRQRAADVSESRNDSGAGPPAPDKGAGDLPRASDTRPSVNIFVLNDELPPRPGEPDVVQKDEVRACNHCGLPVPQLLWDPSREHHFCCAGCETVYGLLAGSGLTDYYDFRARLGEAGRQVVSTEGPGYEFDSPAFHRLYVRKISGWQAETELLLEGVHCAACVWLVERLPRLEPAVLSARLNFARATVTLRWDLEQAPLSRITKTLARMGYVPRPSRGQEAEKMRRAELRSLLVRIGVSGAVAGNVMLMAFALYSGAAGVDEARTMDHATSRFFELASLLVSLPALWAAGLFFRGAAASLRTRTPHMDLPIALGIAAAFGWGAVSAVLGQGELYFDSITTLVFLLLIGRYLQRRHQMAEGDALELLDAVVPGIATICTNDDGEPREVASSDVKVGSKVYVKSGSVVPVDGVVVSGTSCLDKSLLSGESRPITVEPGDEVEAGALNLGAALVVSARRSGEDTRIFSLMRQVEQALSTRTPLIHRADRLAGVFTVVVISLAGTVGLVWGLQSPSLGIERALALLIVACPCALGMATPLSLSAAVRKAAKSKKLVFSPGALERLAQSSELVLDKTGTLTEGKLRVEAVHGDTALLSAVAALEHDARHPVANALCDFARRQPGYVDAQVSDVKETLGSGLRGRFHGRDLLVGSASYVLQHACLSPELARALGELPPRTSPLLVAWGGEVRTLIVLGDQLREDAAQSLLELKARGHRLHLLSGDHIATVQSVAEELGRLAADPALFVSVTGGVDPQQKLSRVKTLQNGIDSRPVVMVGDGVNDAGALAAADVGVAVSGAAEASKMSCDVYLGESGVGELVALLAGSRRTLATITRGIVFSIFYNGVGVTAAALGYLGPLEAAVLMPLSSLTVVTNAYRSRTFEARGGRG